MKRGAGPSPWSWKTGVLTKMCAHRTGSWNFKQQGLYWDLSSSIHVLMTSRIWLPSSCFLKTCEADYRRNELTIYMVAISRQGELRLWAAFLPHPREGKKRHQPWIKYSVVRREHGQTSLYRWGLRAAKLLEMDDIRMKPRLNSGTIRNVFWGQDLTCPRLHIVKMQVYLKVDGLYWEFTERSSVL